MLILKQAQEEQKNIKMEVSWFYQLHYNVQLLLKKYQKDHRCVLLEIRQIMNGVYQFWFDNKMVYTEKAFLEYMK